MSLKQSLQYITTNQVMPSYKDKQTTDHFIFLVFSQVDWDCFVHSISGIDMLTVDCMLQSCW